MSPRVLISKTHSCLIFLDMMYHIRYVVSINIIVSAHANLLWLSHRALLAQKITEMRGKLFL